MAGLSYFIARRYVTSGGKGFFVRFATLISFLGVTVGVLALVVATAMSNGFLVRIREKLSTMNADLTLLGSPLGIPQHELDRIASILDQDSGVKAYAPVISGAVLATSPLHPGGILVRVVGGDHQSLEDVIPLDTFRIDGEKRDGCWLGVDLAKRLGLEVGDSFTAVIPRVSLTPFGALPKIKTLTVTGILKTGYYLYDTEYAYTDQDLVSDLLPTGNPASAILVKLRAPDPNQRVQSRLQSLVGPTFRLVSVEEQNTAFFKALALEKLALAIAVGLIVMVAALNIASSLILLVTQKIRDIGVLRAMGVSASGIRLIFLLQGLVIGVVGTITGLALGIPLCLILDHFQLIPLNPDIYPLTSVPFLLRVSDLLLIGGFAILIALAAAFFPARRASRLDPSSALRHG